MIEDTLEILAHRPDIVRVTISDREGLLIAGMRGQAAPGIASDTDVEDELWTASSAQFITNVTQHLKDLTISKPLEMAVHGTADSLLFAWLNVGWLMARVTPTADWPALWTIVRRIQGEFETLTGGRR